MAGNGSFSTKCLCFYASNIPTLDLRQDVRLKQSAVPDTCETLVSTVSSGRPISEQDIGNNMLQA